MAASKKLGIWMDHSVAYLTDFTSNTFEIKAIESKIADTFKSINSTVIATGRNKTLNVYYNRILMEVKEYNNILLYGPSEAKMEFFDVISEDEQLMRLHIEIKETEAMSKNEQQQFIKNYFSQKDFL